MLHDISVSDKLRNFKDWWHGDLRDYPVVVKGTAIERENWIGCWDRWSGEFFWRISLFQWVTESLGPTNLYGANCLSVEKQCVHSMCWLKENVNIDSWWNKKRVALYNFDKLEVFEDRREWAYMVPLWQVTVSNVFLFGPSRIKEAE